MFLYIQSGVGFPLFSLFPGTNDIAYELLLIIFTSFFIFVSQNISLVVSSNSGLEIILTEIREILTVNTPLLL